MNSYAYISQILVKEYIIKRKYEMSPL